jgi:preprotein translocase subunit SecB
MAEQKPNQANVFDIRKIYLKDASVEAPNTPEVFLEGEQKPEIAIDVSIQPRNLEQEGYYEVVLGVTVTAKVGDKVSFLVEVQQGGVFHITGLPESDLPLALEIACPNVLLPFAREAVSDLVGKAGFPQLLLSPINFEALYIQKSQAKKSEAENTH